MLITLPPPHLPAALLVIFRQNAGYGRFHEGRTRLQAMSAAWTDAYVKVRFRGRRVHALTIHEL